MQKYNLKLGLASFLAAFALFSAVCAAEEDFYFEPLLITADRYEEEETGPGYYKIDEEELAAANYQNVLEVLLHMPGVTLSSRGASRGLNGYDSVLLNGSDRYVVVVDGIRSNWNGSSYNDFDFSVLPADTLSSVEILPAAAGAVYGNAAKGGVIRITTKKAAEGRRTGFRFERGSYGREQESISHFGKEDGWSWSFYRQKDIMGDYSSAMGRIPSHKNTENTSFSLSRSLGSADISFRYSDFDGEYTSKIFNFKRIRQPDGTFKKVKNIFMVDGRKRENEVALEYTQNITDKEKNTLGVYRRGSQASYDEGADAGRPWLLDLRTEGFFDRYTKDWHPKNTLTVGVEYYRDQVLDYQDLISNYGDKEVSSKAVYAQNEWRINEALTATGSLRQDYNSYAGDKLSPAVALSYKPADKVSYHFSFSEYFAPPKQLQLFSPVGDTALLPEEGKIHELGAVYMPDSSWILKANVFHRDAENVIGFSHPMPFVSRYANVGREKAVGVTVSADKQLSESFRVSLTYTKIKADVESRGEDGVWGSKLPRGELLCSLLYSQGKYGAVLQGRGVFDQANGRGEGLYAQNTYWVWDASLRYEINKNAKFYFKVNNVFDQFYSNWENDTDGFLGFDEWYAEPGRNYQIGFYYTF